MARKLRGFERVLDAPALFSVAYGEIASSIYFALGIVAAYALGFTPLVLLGAGVVLPARRALVRRGHRGDPGDGRRRDVRPARASTTSLGFLTGLGAVPRLPDRDRALDALPAALPRRRARRRRRSPTRPWDVVVAVARDRRDRRGPAGAARRGSTRPASSSRRSTSRSSSCSSCSASRSSSRPTRSRTGISLGTAARLGRPRLRAAARHARLHRARDGREPRRGDARAGSDAAAQPLLGDRARRAASPRSIAVVGTLRASRSTTVETALGDEWLRGADRRHRRRARRPAAGGARDRAPRLRRAHGRARPARGGDDLDLRLHAARALARRARPAAARASAASNRRTLVSPQAIVAAAAISIALVIGTGRRRRRRRLPREPLLVRRAARVRRRPGRRDPAAVAASPICRVRSARRSTSRSAARACRCRRVVGTALAVGVWVALARHASRRALRRADLARARARRLSRRAPSRARGCSRTSSRSSSCRRAPTSGASSCR